jgi:hypothetical protein
MSECPKKPFDSPSARAHLSAGRRPEDDGNGRDRAWMAPHPSPEPIERPKRDSRGITTAEKRGHSSLEASSPGRLRAPLPE